MRLSGAAGLPLSLFRRRKIMSEKDCIMTLHSAARAGYLDIVKYLVENGADIYAKDRTGYTPSKWSEMGCSENICGQ